MSTLIYTIDDIANDFIHNPRTSTLRTIFFGPQLASIITINNLYPIIDAQIQGALSALIASALTTPDPEQHLTQALNRLLNSGTLTTLGVNTLLNQHKDVHLHPDSIEGQALSAIYTTVLTAYMSTNGPDVITRLTHNYLNDH